MTKLTHRGPWIDIDLTKPIIEYLLKNQQAVWKIINQKK